MFKGRWLANNTETPVILKRCTVSGSSEGLHAASGAKDESDIVVQVLCTLCFYCARCSHPHVAVIPCAELESEEPTPSALRSSFDSFGFRKFVPRACSKRHDDRDW